MHNAEKFAVGLVQMSVTPNLDANLEKAVARVEEAARQGAQVICLPELFRSQYFCQKEDADLFDLAESVPGPSTEQLGRERVRGRQAGAVHRAQRRNALRTRVGDRRRTGEDCGR